MPLPPHYTPQLQSLLSRAITAPLPPNRPITNPLAAYASTHLNLPHPHTPLPPTSHLPPLLASNGSAISVAIWSALTLNTPEPFTTLASTPTPHFLTPTPSDNLESWWYHELLLLHAFTTYALRTSAPALLDRARRTARYHLEETQPDHATTEPWSLNAFLLSPETYPLADQLLHTLQTQHPTSLDATSAILLTDTLLNAP